MKILKNYINSFSLIQLNEYHYAGYVFTTCIMKK